MQTCFSGAVRCASILAVAALLDGCAAHDQAPGTVPAPPAGAALQAAGLARTHQRAKPSWMDPAAVSKKLLYVSDIGYAQVYVFTYPYLTLAGVLSGFQAPAGMCTDRAGNVWVVDGGTGTGGAIYEYAHGGTSPVNTLPQPNAYPLACAVNPKTGALAVTSNAGDTVYVYGNAFGYPTPYSDPNFCSLMYDGYDKFGNLFVDGYDCSDNFHYAELPAGSSTFTDITLDATPSSPGNVQWDGTYMDVANAASTLYRTQGSDVVGTVTLNTSGLRQYYIVPSHKKVIAPTFASGFVGIYAYPAGGAPQKEIAGGFARPVGTVLSL